MTRGRRMQNRTCSVENCSRTVVGHGLCAMHWKRQYRYGSPLVVLFTKNKGKKCNVGSCQNGAFSKGYCQQHYDSVFKHGREYLILAPDGAGTITKDGYREFNIKGEKILEHVMLAERALGKKLPAKALVHHMNENKTDNYTPFNLVICPDQAYHMLLHKRMRELNWVSTLDKSIMNFK